MNAASGLSLSTAPTPAVPLKQDRGVRLIALYKFIKGTAGVIASLALGSLLATGRALSIDDLASHLEHHFAGAWSVRLAKALGTVLEPHHLRLAALALGLDGVFTLLEGWALHHGHWWGPWLVVVTTSSLLPFEVIALVHHIHAGRVAILILNLAIVGYLAARAAKHRMGASRSSMPSAPHPST
jgi:uncharacterized membrane protein (DUF2068 family)